MWPCKDAKEFPWKLEKANGHMRFSGDTNKCISHAGELTACGGIDTKWSFEKSTHAKKSRDETCLARKENKKRSLTNSKPGNCNEDTSRWWIEFVDMEQIVEWIIVKQAASSPYPYPT